MIDRISSNFNKQISLRENSLEKLKNFGILPYPAQEYVVTNYSTTIKKTFNDDFSQWEVSVAGRIMSRRIMGKVSFVEVQDSQGRIQLYINRDDLCPNENKDLYTIIFKKLLDIGDFIGAKGTVFRTKSGEVSIHVYKLTILAKALRSIPIVKHKNGIVYDAFENPEQRYRERYVDLIVNDNVKNIFLKRTRIFNSMRSFFNKKGYLEVETPILQNIPGGAAARPFKTYHNALDITFYLRISNELYLKRLIVGGFDGVYEFSRNFRNEGMDRIHNPEFTIMEIYIAYKDYYWMMNFTEQMIEHLCLEVLGTTKVPIGEYVIDFKSPYKRITITESILENTGINISDMNEQQIRETCIKFNIIENNNNMDIGKLINELFEKKCEHHYIQPTFITDYPKEMSPLCKIHRDNSNLTERFELIVNGTELANAYSELNDPIDQKNRFKEQLKLLNRINKEEDMFIDYDYLRSLEYGMPPTSGMGIGMDRLVMLLTGQSSIQEVLFFPQMRPKQ